MNAQRPPFRADHVGSLLRPDRLKNARIKHFEDKSNSVDELKAIEDESIKEVVTMQEEVGLKAVTDGEHRRAFWHYDFMGELAGLTLEDRDQEGIQFAGISLPSIFPTIYNKLDFPEHHPHLEHFKYLASIASVTPKISIPGPSCVH